MSLLPLFSSASIVDQAAPLPASLHTCIVKGKAELRKAHGNHLRSNDPILMPVVQEADLIATSERLASTISTALLSQPTHASKRRGGMNWRVRTKQEANIMIVSHNTNSVNGWKLQ